MRKRNFVAVGQSGLSGWTGVPPRRIARLTSQNRTLLRPRSLPSSVRPYSLSRKSTSLGVVAAVIATGKEMQRSATDNTYSTVF